MMTHSPSTQPAPESPAPETETVRMTPLLWILGTAAVLLGIAAGLLMSSLSLTK